MITCPKCSAQNDPSNRFCDQCGFRLEGVAPDASAASAAPTSDEVLSMQPTAPAMKCPSCGADVLPGEAFCDVCGASLQGVAEPVAVNDAPTVVAPPVVGSGVADETANQHPNDAPTTDATPAVPPPSGAGITPSPVDAAMPVASPSNDPQPPAPNPNKTTADAPAVPEPAVASVEHGGDAERQRLEELIATQDKLIAQMEQMQSMFGAATPPAILDGLQQARDTKAQAEADLAALPPPAPQVDPAELARLQDLIATQDKLIAQMEQMQSMFGAATPPAILDGLQQARDTKAQAEADLQALTGGTAPTPAPLPSSVATEVQQPAVSADTPTPPPTSIPAVVPQAEATPTPATPVPATPAAQDQGAAQVPAQIAPMPKPRLVFVDAGKEIPLPLDKAEIIIGREDPISQIFPEVDLTPFGGETGGVSRQHARITQSDGQWMLTDLNSTNYTRVDGVKIDPQVPVAIRDGARLQFGRIATVFHI